MGSCGESSIQLFSRDQTGRKAFLLKSKIMNYTCLRDHFPVPVPIAKRNSGNPPLGVVRENISLAFPPDAKIF